MSIVHSQIGYLDLLLLLHLIVWRGGRDGSGRPVSVVPDLVDDGRGCGHVTPAAVVGQGAAQNVKGVVEG